MKEVEVKILNIDSQKVKQTLLRLGAKKVFDGEVFAYFYDFKDSSIAKSHSVMRLRKEGDQIVLTFKKVLGKQGAKIAEESSVEVSNLSEMKKILENLGLSVTGSTQKYRVSYQLETAHFDIDHYIGQHSYIPELMEIEAESIHVIHKWAELLGFKAQDCLPWSINDLIKYYSPRNQVEKS
jgi:adenylate cyclase, class 2